MRSLSLVNLAQYDSTHLWLADKIQTNFWAFKSTIMYILWLWPSKLQMTKNENCDNISLWQQVYAFLQLLFNNRLNKS